MFFFASLKTSWEVEIISLSSTHVQIFTFIVRSRKKQIKKAAMCRLNAGKSSYINDEDVKISEFYPSWKHFEWSHARVKTMSLRNVAAHRTSFWSFYSGIFQLEEFNLLEIIYLMTFSLNASKFNLIAFTRECLFELFEKRELLTGDFCLNKKWRRIEISI